MNKKDLALHGNKPFRLPSRQQRVMVLGRTGSGKTVLGAWLLSKAPFDRQPYIMIDYKYDSLLNSVDRIKEIGLNEVPKQPGLYIVHPRPDIDNEALENLFWKIWARENTGVFIDEYFSVPDTAALRSLLTQGRSKNIPIIGHSQRPSWISRFAFSESDFFAVFHLSDKEDRLKVNRMANTDADLRLPQYYSQWYDVANDQHFILQAAPKPEEIQQVLFDRLAPKRRFT